MAAAGRLLEEALVDVAVLARHGAQEVAGEQRDVLLARLEAGESDLDREAGEQVVLEGVGFAVGRRDHPHPRAPRPGLAEALVFAVVHHAQEVGLGVVRELADLVEEERAAVGLADQAVALGMPAFG
jgi:hypothetical protein